MKNYFTLEIAIFVLLWVTLIIVGVKIASDSQNQSQNNGFYQIPMATDTLDFIGSSTPVRAILSPTDCKSSHFEGCGFEFFYDEVFSSGLQETADGTIYENLLSQYPYKCIAESAGRAMQIICKKIKN